MEAPITLSAALNISSDEVVGAGTLDVTLNCDTNLFLDPLLMRESSDKKFAAGAHEAFVSRFELIIKLINAISSPGDKAERAAREQLSFPEIRYTHLGFSKSTKGAGSGTAITESLVDSAKQVIALGTEDPDLFLALALFEDNIGPDRISDMTTNIVIECLSEFNCRAAKKLGIPVQLFQLSRKKLEFPANPIAPHEPLILVPSDIVRQLPVAADWDSVRAAARASGDFRRDLNNFVGEIWAAKTAEKKRAVKNAALRSKEAFQELLDLLKSAADEPYDINGDVAGELYPSDLERLLSDSFPLDLSRYQKGKLSLDQVDQVVIAIIEHFTSLIEDNGIWRELWLDDLTTDRLEKAIQRIFFVAASAFCKSNNLDLTPESDAGAGPVDFKVSQGSDAKVLVEIKRSRNPHLIHGYKTQLETYKRAEKTMRAHYVIVNVGGLTQKKLDRLNLERKTAIQVNGLASEIWFVDGSVQESASKRRS